MPSCFPCQDFLPSLESSGVLSFEAQDLLCKKSRRFRGEKSNGLICLSPSQSIPAERGCEQTQLREDLSSWKLMDSVLLLEGYCLCFQNRTTKAQINPPSLGNCPLFCSPTGTRGCWGRFITETLSLLGSRARQAVPGEEKGHILQAWWQSCWDRVFLWGMASACCRAPGPALLERFPAQTCTPPSQTHPSPNSSLCWACPSLCLGLAPPH